MTAPIQDRLLLTRGDLPKLGIRISNSTLLRLEAAGKFPMRLAAVQILEDADWLSAQTHVKLYKGWPRGYSVHPKVFEIFAREGEQWRARRAAVKDAIGEGA